MNSNNVPSMLIMGAYDVGEASGQVITRIKAFIEMLEQSDKYITSENASDLDESAYAGGFQKELSEISLNKTC